MRNLSAASLPIGICALIILSISHTARGNSIDYGSLGDSCADKCQIYPSDPSTARNVVDLSATDRNINLGYAQNLGYAGNRDLDVAESVGLADGPHIGTAGRVLPANAFISVADKQFDAGIPPLTGSEIIQSAQVATPTAIPLPPTWQTAGVGLLGVAFIGILHKSRRLRRFTM